MHYKHLFYVLGIAVTRGIDICNGVVYALTWRVNRLVSVCLSVCFVLQK